jgi:hypothetical protein
MNFTEEATVPAVDAVDIEFASAMMKLELDRSL